jgi:hypothetical protein
VIKNTKSNGVRPGICALCETTCELQLSHIFSKWCFKRSYNAKHQLKVVGTPDLVSKNMQDAYKEYLLCRDCENHLSKWEGYAAGYFCNPPGPIKDVGFAYCQKNIEAQVIKRFLLSLTLRASFSSLPPFAEVSLGKKHESNLRKLLLSEEKIPEQVYPTLLYRLMADSEPLKDLFHQPTTERIEGHNLIRLTFSGHLAHVFVSSHPVPKQWETYLLGDIPEVKVHRKDIQELPWLRAEWDHLKKTGRLEQVLRDEKAERKGKTP